MWRILAIPMILGPATYYVLGALVVTFLVGLGVGLAI